MGVVGLPPYGGSPPGGAGHVTSWSYWLCSCSVSPPGAFCSGAVVRGGLLAFYQQDRGINVSSAMLCGFGTSALIPTAPEFHQSLPHWGEVLGVGADLMCRGGTCWPPSIYCLSRTVCALGGAFTHRPVLSSGVLRTGVGLRCTSLCAACVFGLWCGMLVHMLAGLRAMVGHGVQCWPPVFLWDCGVRDVLCVFFSSLQLRFRVGHLRCGGPLDRFWCGWMVWTLQSIFIAWSWFLGMLPVVCDWWCRVVMSSR